MRFLSCDLGYSLVPAIKSPFYISMSVIILTEISLYYSPRPLLGEGFFLPILN